jgi:uncharacterized protein
MRAFVSGFLVVMALAVAGRATAEAVATFAPARPAANDVMLDSHVPIMMRDGVTLYADVYRPVGPGPFPVIVGRTPYSIERYATPVYQYPNSWEAPLFFARRGYVFVYQDIRGREESEGHWEPFRNDIADGYDTIEWAARQPWSNGKVAMDGVSYEGTVQWRAAMSAPPHLVTIVPSVASTSLYNDWITSNGAWRLAFNLEWGAIRMETRTVQNSGVYLQPDSPPSLRLADIERHLPLLDIQTRVGRKAQFFQDWLAHPDFDAYWKAIDAEEVFDRIPIPVLNFGGWFDIFRQGTLRGYEGMRDRGKTDLARHGTRLVMGPYGHWPSRKVGELDFGPTAFVDQNTLALEWFDYWLKGIDNGVGKRSPVRLFVMGANEWRDEDDFPPARARTCRLYFQSQGHANTALGDGRLVGAPPANDPADSYTYDPAEPTPAAGGGSNVRLIEARSDTLVYTSDPLDGDLEVIGPLRVILHAASDAPDTDFVARLIDVYPDGRALAIADGILRARYREGTSNPKLLQPGTTYALTIDLTGTAMLFAKGHRLRVHLTSSAFPAFDRNPNTAHPFGTSAEIRAAHQTVRHSRRYPSYIELPVTNSPTARPRPIASAACVR